MRPTSFAAILLVLSQVYLGTALPTNRHELIAKRGDLTEPIENRAFAPSVDLETREPEEFWLIARGDDKPKPRPLPPRPLPAPPAPPPAPRPLPPIPVQPPPAPAPSRRPLPLAKGKAKER